MLRPPVILPISRSMVSAAWRSASFTAAITRSCSISTSSGSTASGLMVSASSLFFAVDLDCHHTAARGRLKFARVQRGLHFGHLLLQLPAPAVPIAACCRRPSFPGIRHVPYSVLLKTFFYSLYTIGGTVVNEKRTNCRPGSLTSPSEFIHRSRWLEHRQTLMRKARLLW